MLPEWEYMVESGKSQTRGRIYADKELETLRDETDAR